MANQFATFFTIKPFYNESFGKLDLQERVPHRCYSTNRFHPFSRSGKTFFLENKNMLEVVAGRP
jgi:hypothetical protein